MSETSNGVSEVEAVPDAKNDEEPRQPGTTPNTSEVEAVPDAGRDRREKP